MAIIKIDDNTFTKDTPTEYKLDELVARRDFFVKQKALKIANQDKKIAEVDALIAEAKSAGLKEIVIDK